MRDAVQSAWTLRTAIVIVGCAVALLEKETDSAAFLAVSVAYLAVLLAQRPWFHGEDWAQRPIPALIALDGAWLATAIALSSDVPSALFWLALPIVFVASSCLSGALLLRAQVVALACCGAVALASGITDDQLAWAGSYALTTLMVMAISHDRARRRVCMSASLRALADDQRMLLARHTGELADERRRLSQQLHDEALQTLLAARQDLTEVAQGEDEALDHAAVGLDHGIRAVRRLVADIDPAALAGSRLPDALRSLAVRIGNERGLTIATDLDPEASCHHDDLLYDIARALLGHAMSDPRTTHVGLSLMTGPDGVEMTIADDAEPTPHEDELLRVALTRLETIGGTLDARFPPTGGIVVRVSVRPQSVADERDLPLAS